MMFLHSSRRITSRVSRGKSLATKLLIAKTTTTTTTNQFFSSSAENILDGSNNNGDDIAHCDVVQGPSLLRTPAIRPHPSLLFLPGLRSLPFWTSDTTTSSASSSPSSSSSPRRIAYNDPAVTKAVKYLESNIDIIREEYLRVSPSMTSDYDGLQDHVQTHSSGSSGSGVGSDSKDDKNGSQLHEGTWDWYTYMSKGNIQGHFVLKFPETSRIINEGFRGLNNNYQLFEGTPFGFAFFSSLGPGAKIASHNAPTNLRLRIHLPIVVPTTTTTTTTSSKSSSEKDGNDDDDDDINKETGLPYCGIRVGNSIRSYQNNDNNALVLDDAFDHEVWNDTNVTRVVLLVDIWHPDINRIEKEAIVDMFQTAKKAGLWKR